MQKSLDPMSVQKAETPSASYVLRRRYGPARHVIAAASWITVISMLLQPVVAFAVPVTGFLREDNNEGSGWDYNDTANWVGGTINGIWNDDLSLIDYQTVYFGTDIVLGHGWTFNYPDYGGVALTLMGSGGDYTVTLGGNISMNNLGGTPSGGVVIGSQMSGQNLNIDLGGATRTFRSFSGYETESYLTFENAITGSGGTYGITVDGSSTWVYLRGDNTYTGATTLNNGKLILDYWESDTSKLSDSAALTLGGAGLQITGGTFKEVVDSTTINAGASSIHTASSGSLRLSLNAITRNAGGTLRIRYASTTDTDSSNVNGILGGWAVMNTGSSSTANWATSATSANNTLITALASGSYTTLPTSGGSGTVNYKMTAVTTLAGSFSVNSLKLEAPTGNLLLGARTLTINSGGLLMTGTTGRSITGTAGATRLTADSGGGYELIVHQYNSGGLTISAVIGDNGGHSVALTKSGSGPLILSDANTYTGQTYLNEGVMQVDGTLDTQGAGGTVNVKGVEDVNGLFSTVLCGSGTINRPVVLTDGASILGGPSDQSGGTLTLGSDLTLASGNTARHRGGTVSVAGTATINGWLSTGGTPGTLEIASGGTLKGTGRFGDGQSRVVIKEGGTLRPGGSIGQLILAVHYDDLAQGLVHESGSIFAWEAKGYDGDGSIGTAGTDYSQVAMDSGATFTLASGTLGKLYFPTGEDFTGTFWGINRSWDIITGGSSSSSGSIADGDISIFVNGSSYGAGNTVTGKGSFSTSNPAAGILRLTWTATSGGGVATHLALTTEPVGGQSGKVLATQPVVEIRDSDNNKVSSDNSTVVTVAIKTGSGGTLGGPSLTATAVNGVATFSGVTLAGTVGQNYVLTFTSVPEYAAVDSGNVTVTAGDATQLALTTAPVAGRSGDALTTQPVVEIRDAQGNKVLTDNATVVTVAIKTGSGGTLGGPSLTATAVNGVATFSGVTLTGPVGNIYELTFTSSPLASVDSGNVTVAGPATRLVVTGAGGDMVAGQTREVTITAKDAAGITDMLYTGTKSLVFSGAGTSPNGTIPTVTDKDGNVVNFGIATPADINFVAGVATVGSGKNGVITLYKKETALVSVSDGTISSTGSDRLSVTVRQNGDLTKSSATANPSTGVSTDGGATATITVTAMDSYGNINADGFVVWAWASGTGQTFIPNNMGDVNQAFTYTDANGQATFTIASTKAETKTLQIYVGSWEINAHPTVGFVPGAATAYRLTGSGQPQVGENYTMTVTQVDQHQNTTTLGTSKSLTFNGPGGQTLSAGTDASPATINGVAQNTAANVSFSAGVGTVTLVAHKAESSKVISVTDGTLTSSGTGGATLTVSPTAGADSAYRISAATTTPQVGANDTLTITIVDKYQNLSSYTGSKTITFGGLSVGPDNSKATVAGTEFGTGTTISFSGGTASGSPALVAHKAESLKLLTATDGSLTAAAEGGMAPTLSPTAGEASKLVFTSAPVSTPAGTASSSITIERQDLYGNAVTTESSSRTVLLSSSSSGTVIFNPVSPLTIANGSSSASFTYTDSKEGTPTITVQSTSPTAITQGQQQETVTARTEVPGTIFILR